MPQHYVDETSLGQALFAHCAARRRAVARSGWSRRSTACGKHPGGTLPDKLSSPADLKALYRLCDCEAVTHAARGGPAHVHAVADRTSLPRSGVGGARRDRTRLLDRSRRWRATWDKSARAIIAATSARTCWRSRPTRAKCWASWLRFCIAATKCPTTRRWPSTATVRRVKVCCG